MKQRLWLIPLLVAVLYGNVGQSQQGGDVERHDIDPRVALGPPRRLYVLYVPEEDNGQFLGIIQRFAAENGFVHISGHHGLKLSDHYFGSDWYTRPDGVTFLITDIGLPAKMNMAFYNRDDGGGAEQAVVMAEKLRQATSQFRDYEE